MGEDSGFKWQDTLGVFLALGGMAELPLTLRICFFAACAICLTISLSSRKSWAKWIRWTLSVAVVCLMSLISWFVAHVKSDHAPNAAEMATKSAQPAARPDIHSEGKPTASPLARRHVLHLPNGQEPKQAEDRASLLRNALDWQKRFAGFVKEWEANQAYLQQFYGRGNPDARFHMNAKDAGNTEVYFRDYAPTLNDLRMQLKGEVDSSTPMNLDYLERPRWKTETGQEYLTVGDVEDILADFSALVAAYQTKLAAQ